MAKEFTEKSRFKSKYTDGYVAGPQYLVELICEKIAAKRKVTLPYKFWNVSPWDKTFKTQLSHANKLIKSYDVYVIIQALKDRRCYNLESLGAKHILEPILKEYLRKEELMKSIDDEKIVEKTSEVVAPANTRRKPISKKNLLGDL